LYLGDNVLLVYKWHMIEKYKNNHNPF